MINCFDKDQRTVVPGPGAINALIHNLHLPLRLEMMSRR